MNPWQNNWITADDWGLSPGVNAGILALAQRGIVRRVSMMPNTPYLTTHLEELKRIPGLQMGIHFNITYGRPLSREMLSPSPLIDPNTGEFPPLSGQVRRWLLGQNRALLIEAIQVSLREQLTALNEKGILPSYFDGHQHIHLLPGFIAAISSILRSHRIHFIRIPLDPRLALSTHFPIFAFSILAKREARRLGLVTLPCRYPAQSTFASPDRVYRLLSKYRDTEFIVHPARFMDFEELNIKDPLRSQRVLQYNALLMNA